MTLIRRIPAASASLTCRASAGPSAGAPPAQVKSAMCSPSSIPATILRDVTGTAGGWERWSWDETLFAGSAGYYERGRVPYAPGLAGALARSLELDGRG